MGALLLQDSCLPWASVFGALQCSVPFACDSTLTFAFLLMWEHPRFLAQVQYWAYKVVLEQSRQQCLWPLLYLVETCLDGEWDLIVKTASHLSVLMD